jgi:hypothetical protein
VTEDEAGRGRLPSREGLDSEIADVNHHGIKRLVGQMQIGK